MADPTDPSSLCGLDFVFGLAGVTHRQAGYTSQPTLVSLPPTVLPAPTSVQPALWLSDSSRATRSHTASCATLWQKQGKWESDSSPPRCAHLPGPAAYIDPSLCFEVAYI